jgi:hypothetical protein
VAAGLTGIEVVAVTRAHLIGGEPGWPSGEHPAFMEEDEAALEGVGRVDGDRAPPYAGELDRLLAVAAARHLRRHLGKRLGRIRLAGLSRFGAMSKTVAVGADHIALRDLHF